MEISSFVSQLRKTQNFLDATQGNLKSLIFSLEELKYFSEFQEQPSLTSNDLSSKEEIESVSELLKITVELFEIRGTLRRIQEKYNKVLEDLPESSLVL
jgi:hypothetical protein